MQRHKYQTDPNNPEMFYEEFHIPKKNGKTRRICAPSTALKAYQRSILPNYYNEFNIQANRNNVTHMFHGFLPNRNIVTAAMCHIGYATTVLMDISNCFDSINYTNQPDTNVIHKDGTLAQGFVTSPIIANIQLIQPIKKINEDLQAIGIDCAITVYADDITISTNATDYNIINLIPIIVTTALQEHRLNINPSKTRIRYAKFGRRKVLGIMVGESDLKPSRRLKGKIRAARFQANGPSLGGLVTASRNYLPKALRGA